MSAKLDPVTGPISKDKLKELVNAPHGAAVKVIREYDPQWGRARGEKFDWKVRVERDGTGTGTAHVEAATKEEAVELADELDESEIDWDYPTNDFVVVSVEPNRMP